MRFFLIFSSVLCVMTGDAFATDARLSYKTADGSTANAAIISPVCSVSSDGTPETCSKALSAETSTSGNMSYVTAGGMRMTVTPFVPVCSVVDGVPQICDLNQTPDLSAYLTITAAQSSYAQLAVQNSFTAEQHFANAYFADPDQGVSRDAKFGDRGIAVGGGTKTDTLTVTGASSVIDTATTDSSKTILNTESAASRFVSKATAAATYETIAGMSSYVLATNGKLTTPTITQPSIDAGTLTTDGKGNLILSGNNGIKFGDYEWLNYNSTYKYIAVNGDLEITGRVNLPTRTTGDNGNYAASTAFVQNTISALQGSVTGDLSASGSSLSLTLGTTNLKLTMAYSAAGTGSLSIVSTSGTVTPVDIYETAAWGTTSFKGYTLDAGSVTTTATVIDSTFYLSSNAWGTYHIGAGGSLYIVDIFGSGAGKRTVISWRKVL